MQEFELFLWECLRKHNIEAITPALLISENPEYAEEIQKRISGPEDILIYLWQNAHEYALANTSAQSGKDFLFDYFMALADYSQPHKVTIKKIITGLLCLPLLTLKLNGFATHWAHMVLEKAQLEETALPIIILRYGFLALTLWIMHQWMDDDTPDQAQTMVAVDTSLDQFLGINETLKGWGCRPR
jgi:hypothetical protein